MKDNDILNKKRASYVTEYDNGDLIQSACYVDEKTGLVDIGAERFVNSRIDSKSSPIASHIEYHGKRFDLEFKKDGEVSKQKVTHLDAFKQEGLKEHKQFVESKHMAKYKNN